MIGTVILRNPLSTRNRGRPSPPRPYPVLEPSLTELRPLLTDLKARNTHILAVDGGDGTLREVVTALMELDWRPRLAVMAGGGLNLVARDVGMPPHLLCRPGGVARRRLLRLDHGGGTAYGMFLGAGAFVPLWEMATARMRRLGLAGIMEVAAAMLAGLLRRPSGTFMAVDGQAYPRFLLLATTLERLMLGLWPFWGQGEGVRLLDVAAPPRRLPAALPALVRGRPKGWMESCGYHSRRAPGFRLESAAPVVLDGELFLPAGDGFRLSAGPEMEFLIP